MGMYAHLAPALVNHWIFLIFLYLVYICSAQMVMGDFFPEKFIFALFGQICVFGPLEAEKWPIGHFSAHALRKHTQNYPFNAYFDFSIYFTCKNIILAIFMPF